MQKKSSKTALIRDFCIKIGEYTDKVMGCLGKQTQMFGTNLDFKTN